MKFDWTKIWDILVQLEETFTGTGNGSDKRAAAIAAINSVVDIPYVPEAVEAIIIGWLVDGAVSLFNRLFGHAWLDKVKALLDEQKVQG